MLEGKNAGKEEVPVQGATAETSDSEEKDCGGEAGTMEEEVEDMGLSADEFEHLFRRFAQEDIPIRVLEVKVEGNRKTWSSVIQDHLEPLRKVASTRQLLREAAHAVNRIEDLGLFENCSLSLEAGPVDGSVSVVLYVEEAPRPSFLVNLASFSVAEDAVSAFGGSITWRNALGYGEDWDAICNYGWGEERTLTTGFRLPRFGYLPNNLAARVAIHAPEWSNFSNYKLSISRITLGFSNKYHDLSYNVAWNVLSKEDDKAAPLLFPGLKYSFKFDQRDTESRPLRGYAFKVATEIVGGSSDLSMHFARQDMDLRLAIPLGSSLNAAFNIGLSGGIIFSQTRDYFQKPTFLSEHFFVGRNCSLLNGMNGPSTILSLFSRCWRKATRIKNEDCPKTSESEKDFRGNLALTGFADISFDLPWGSVGKPKMYGHCFICTGNLANLSEPGRIGGQINNFISSMKCLVGAGIVFPTRLFCIEVNFCHMLRPANNHGSKSGVQIGFTSPG